MAYQVRQRDPLFDASTQASIERRSKELLGLLLLGVGIAFALLLVSYSPDDPSWRSATDRPVQNVLGSYGAALASPLIVIVGWAAWGLAIIPTVWGLRFLLHVGEVRVMARAVFAPLAVALASIYASTLVPVPGWNHSFGLGGLFGDTALGAVLGVLPVDLGVALKVMALISAAGASAVGLYVFAVSPRELKAAFMFFWRGIVMFYAGIATVLTRGTARGAVAAAGGVRALASGRRRPGGQARDRVARTEAVPAYDDDDDWDIEDEAPIPPLAAPQPKLRKGGLGALLRRTPPLVAAAPGPQPASAAPAGPAPQDRVSARIQTAIQARAHNAPPEQARAEPPLHRRHPLGPAPMLLADAEAAAVEPAAVAEARLVDRSPLSGPEDLLEDIEMPEPELVTGPPARLPTAAPEPDRRVVQHPPRQATRPSARARAEAQPALQFEDPLADYEPPPLNLLTNPEGVERHHLSDEALEENARMLEVVLDDYGIKGEIVSVRPGPVVTMYELEPAPGLKASRVIGLADDIARSMSALSARVSTVPGRSVIGIELPNVQREKVVLREILSSRNFGDSQMRLPLALGKDIGGGAVVANLAKMPHLLIAGTTGSGKSVAINTMILSLLYRLTPEECRLIMIDPKMLELSVYDGIPHLLSPVVTDPKKAVVALKWVVGEMEERYRKMSRMGVRNIEGYNGRVRDALDRGEMFSRTVQTGFDDNTGDPVFETEETQPEPFPYIVVIVDEMADLMMVAGKEIEACIQRLAQMARASGIHLIMATQRPSVDVITGTIKANFPTRISFQVTSKIDSRTILGEQGAEQLLGMGDMLYMAGGAKITRVHGPFVSDEEVEEVVTHLKAFGPPDYVGGVVQGPDDDRESDIDAVLGLGGNTDGEDALYDQAVAIVIRDRKCSTSYIQRKLAIGYNKAARLVEKMEDQGVVSAANHVGKREILVPEQQ